HVFPIPLPTPSNCSHRFLPSFPSRRSSDLGCVLAETFFNSVTRRIFSTVGVDPRIEFVDTDFDSPPIEAMAPLYRSYPSMGLVDLVAAILEDAGLGAPFADLDRDARLAAERISEHLTSVGALRVVDRAEIIDAVFF